MKNKKMFAIIAGIVVACIVIILSGIFIYKKVQVSNLIKRADSLVKLEDYDPAMDIYEELYLKTGKTEYLSTKNAIQIKKEMKNIMNDAKENESNENYVKAISLYKKIPKEDTTNYPIASTKVLELKTEAINRIKQLKNAGNTSVAIDDLNSYLTYFPDDKTGLDLLKSMTGESKPTTQVIVKESSGNNSGGISAAKAVASNIRNTYQTITSGEANVRSGASKSSPVIGSISKGSSVYIYDTYVESESRIWCLTDEGWISYNTMNGSIR